MPRFVKSNKVRAFRAINWSDWRIWTIIVATFIALGLTFYFAELSKSDLDVGFWKSFYASWTANVTLLLVVGIVVAVVSLHDAAMLTFSERVRVLLRGREGQIARYLAKRLEAFEPYIESMVRNLQITDYNKELNAYKITTKVTTKMRGFFDDVPCRSDGEMAFRPDNFPVTLNPVGEVVFIKQLGGDEGEKIFEKNRSFGSDGITLKFYFALEAGVVVTIETESWVWYSAKEVHEYSALRYTEHIFVTIENLIKDSHRPQIAIEKGTRSRQFYLEQFMGREVLCDANFVEPDVENAVYRFRFVPDGLADLTGS